MADEPTVDDGRDAPGTHRFERCTAEEIDVIATGIIMGRIYWPPDEVALDASFAPMMMLGFAKWAPEDIEQVGWVYEHEDRAGTVCVNGYPTFLLTKLVHKDDVQPIMDRYRAKYEAMQAG